MARHRRASRPRTSRSRAPTAPTRAVAHYSLAEFRGQPVVLVFYPGDNTPVCTRQLNAYTADIDAFEDVGAQVLAISPQSVESPRGFSCKQGGFAFPLLADEDKARRRGLRHPRPARLLPALGVRDRRRGHRPLRPPGRRRPHLPPHRGARRRGAGRCRFVVRRPRSRRRSSGGPARIPAPGRAARLLSGCPHRR